jgi:3',5'-cyclic AMP phosphodiesterase CpdA
MQYPARFLLSALPALPALLLAASGCIKGTPDSVGQDDEIDGGRPVYQGGSMPMEACGDDLVVRLGATVPVLGTPVLGPDPTPRQVHLGLQNDPRTSIVVQWRTSDEATLASTVQYGEGDALDQTIEGAMFVFQSGFSGNGGTVRMHEAHLCGLKPDTVYSYRVGGEAGGVSGWSETFQFRTAPDLAPDSDDEVVVAFVGDSRDGYDVWATLVALMQEKAPDLILFSGDAVTFGQIQLEWDYFFDAAQPLFARVPVVSAHGNHEGNAINYYAQFAMPGSEEQFAIDYGALHVTVANDSPEEPSDVTTRVADYLRDELAASADRPWQVVMHHKPIWSASANHGGDDILRESWQPIFDAAQVDLVLSGHDHDYERTEPMRGDSVTPGGTTYLVSGGAGAQLYGNGMGFWTHYSEKTHSLVMLRIRKSAIVVESFRDDGSQIETFTLEPAGAGE